MIHSADVGRGVIGVIDVSNLMVCTFRLHFIQVLYCFGNWHSVL